jgi:hypothetical protein
MLAHLADRFLTHLKTGSESMQTCGPSLPIGSESVQRRCQDWLEHHSPADHADLLVTWIRANIDTSRVTLFREGMQEFYAEAINDAGWAARPWNPVARHLDLICTGGRKPYVWVMTPTGRMRRRRCYPIPKSAELKRVP